MDFDGAVGGARTPGVRTEYMERAHARNIEKIQENWKLQSLEAWLHNLPADIRPAKTPANLGMSFITNLCSISTRVTSTKARALFIAECNHATVRFIDTQNILDALKRSRSKEAPGQLLKATESSKSTSIQRPATPKPRQNGLQNSPPREANTRCKQPLHDLQVGNDKDDNNDSLAPIRPKQTSSLKTSNRGRQDNHIVSTGKAAIGRKDLLRDLRFNDDNDNNDHQPPPKKLKKDEPLTPARPALREPHGMSLSPSVSPLDSETEFDLFGESTELVEQRDDAAVVLPPMTSTCEPLLEQFSVKPGDLSREIYAACSYNAIENEKFFGRNQLDLARKDDSFGVSHSRSTVSKQSSQVPCVTESLDLRDNASGQPLGSSVSITKLPLVAEPLNPATTIRYITHRKLSDPFLHPRRIAKNRNRTTSTSLGDFSKHAAFGKITESDDVPAVGITSHPPSHKNDQEALTTNKP